MKGGLVFRAASVLAEYPSMSTSHLNLAAKYRPQTFAQVAGQEAITRVLSRAVAEARVAPAYLFSGTRGVGKTTVARILAKALNCLNGPAPEPCNVCPMCRKVTAGVAVDVVEIDGATHTGIDAVRQLQEDVAQLPLEGRRKVVIIDEAHMLSKSAFNGLLKTLEEPPPHVVFILASTEPEKFPITIRSRCQHFVFQRLSLGALLNHLTWVLEREGVAFEPAAVRLVARRGGGSVRDALSILAQVVALAGERLTAAEVRSALGMVDSGTFLALLEALAGRDLAAVHTSVEHLVDRGVDIGFFVRELTALWRDVFLLRRLGEQALALLDWSEEDAVALARVAARFSTAHAHAAWQMSLEAQRSVTQSPDPGLALELHLVNLALIPELVPVEEALGGGPPLGKAVGGAGREEGQAVSLAAATPAVQGGAGGQTLARAPQEEKPPAPAKNADALRSSEVLGPSQGEVRVLPADAKPSDERGPSWEGFVTLLQRQGLPPQLGQQLRGEVRDDVLVVAPANAFGGKRFQEFVAKIPLDGLIVSYFGRPLRLQVVVPNVPVRKTKAELREMAMQHPDIQAARQRLQATIVDVWPNTGGNSGE